MFSFCRFDTNPLGKYFADQCICHFYTKSLFGKLPHTFNLFTDKALIGKIISCPVNIVENFTCAVFSFAITGFIGNVIIITASRAAYLSVTVYMPQTLYFQRFMTSPKGSSIPYAPYGGTCPPAGLPQSDILFRTKF